MSKALDILFETRAETHRDASRMLVAKVPDMHNLLLLPSYYPSSDKPDNESDHHWTTLKCRTIIFSGRFDGLLASPSYFRPNYIDIIVSKKNCEQEEFRSYMKSLNLHFASTEQLTLMTYERCLRYSVLARLSPLWNQVGPYIIPGRDFITETKPMDALRINFVMKESDLHLIMWPVRVKLWPMLSEHFAAEPIHQDNTYRLINYTTAFVMPSLKEAEICFLSTKLPENSVFSSYEEVKKYWKNTHGYRLPDEQNGGVTYMSVRFSARLPVMTYPLACLQCHPPTVLKVKNETVVLSEFLGDLLRRMPVICGYPFGTHTSVGVAVQKLLNDTIFSEQSHLLSIPVDRFTQINPKFLEEPNNDHVLESSTSVQKPVSSSMSSSSFMSTSNDAHDNNAENTSKYKPIFTSKKENPDQQVVRNEFVPGPSNRGNPIKMESAKFTPIFLPRKSLVKSTPTGIVSQISSSSGPCHQQPCNNSKEEACVQPASLPKLVPNFHSHVRAPTSVSNVSKHQKFAPLFLARPATPIKPAVKSTQLRVPQINNCRPTNKYPLFFPQPVNHSAVSSSSDFLGRICSPTRPVITSQSTEMIQVKNMEASSPVNS
ncbi:hypothetical protein LSTR_LSTR014613 [Laodelphax striatellus]|uniref:DUF4708 domain-containing protein n=1 Tax=Laodelphax striatellus TaxID=195883 RepID=A0A482XAT9_LAOST|nr:hypothetical protein LSTR_LSTR014613 [Laodelphax striatellus]